MTAKLAVASNGHFMVHAGDILFQGLRWDPTASSIAQKLQPVQRGSVVTVEEKVGGPPQRQAIGAQVLPASRRPAARAARCIALGKSRAEIEPRLGATHPERLEWSCAVSQVPTVTPGLANESPRWTES